MHMEYTPYGDDFDGYYAASMAGAREPTEFGKE